MAATNYTPISLYYSTTVSAAPVAGNLVNGELAINITDGKLYYKDNGGNVQIIASKAAAAVTSGTSGGVPYYSSATTIASSAALAANALVIGGGAGAAPATTTTGTGVVTALGVNVGTAGAFVVNGGALGTPSSGTVTNLTGTASISINGTVGATTPNTGAFTTLSASSTVSGTGFSTYLASPPAIGGTSANTGSFTTLSASAAGSTFASYVKVGSSGDASTNFYLQSTSAGQSLIRFQDASSVTQGSITYDQSAGTMTFATGAANRGVFSSTGLSVTGTLSATQSITAQGSTTLASGAGVEVIYSGGAGYVQSYNRTGSAYTVLNISGSTTNIQASGSTIGAFSSTGLSVTGTLSATGLVGLGTSTNATIGVYSSHSTMSGATQREHYAAPVFGSAATIGGNVYESEPTLASASFTMGTLSGFRATNVGALSGGAAVTTQVGFYAPDQTRGTNNYGFLGEVTSGSGKYNLYMSGTAANYMAGGLQMGSPTGGDKGAGTINVAGDIYKNNTAYTNPDYVLEHWATGKIEKFVDKAGASEYAGLMPLDDLETYLKSNLHLPRFGQQAEHGLFSGSDALLASVEEAHLYILQLKARIEALESRLSH